jgi:hypothetical protein
VLALATGRRRADGSIARSTSARALRRRRPRLTRGALADLARGLDLAEAAVALDERSADAHFAIVCNLGKATSSAASASAPSEPCSLAPEIDVTLALAPNHAEALAAKGALLDQAAALARRRSARSELWLRRALAVDPDERDGARLPRRARPPSRRFVAPRVRTDEPRPLSARRASTRAQT